MGSGSRSEGGGAPQRDATGAGSGLRRTGGRIAAKRASQARVLRIIGGMWRGRKLRFPDAAEIRPTPDRVRETLFNWLAARLPGARCLDLFAGSGALGLESLSRGADQVTFVERDATAVRELRARLAEWGASGGEVEQGDALRFLGSGGNAAGGIGTRGGSSAVAADGGGSAHDGTGAGGGAGVGRSTGGGIAAGAGGNARAFDIVFLDPPFDSNLLTPAAERLETGGWLAPGALIYVECAARTGLPPLPLTWTTTKAKQAGEVGYHLLTRA